VILTAYSAGTGATLRINKGYRKETDMKEKFDRVTEEANALRVTDSDPSHEIETEKSLGKSMLMKVALASLVVATLVIGIANVMRINQLNAQKEEMQAKYERLREENKKLQYFLNKEVDEDYIIEYARDVQGMYFPDEDVYYNDVNK
jgi:cell division protein FtsB